MTVENMRAPAGATQTLEPRPLPVTCVVAVAVNPCGNRRTSCGFLEGLGGTSLTGEGLTFLI